MPNRPAWAAQTLAGLHLAAGLVVELPERQWEPFFQLLSRLLGASSTML